MLGPRPGERILDVGCGTGYFTRRIALDGHAILGIDAQADAVLFARAHAAAGERYLRGDARALPFPDRAFDCSISVTALCFIEQERVALAEMIRVTRRRVVLGLLNRNSLLYLQKGRHGGKGAYRGARWHTPHAIRALFSSVPVARLSLRSAVFLPGGGLLARGLEKLLSERVVLGAFIAAAADLAASKAT